MVYRARDVRLRRDVAVKLLRRELVSTEGFVERFEREAQALAALRHPGIVPVYSIGDQGELIYLVMPFIEGITLTEYLREHRPLPLDEAERILGAVGSALTAAHAVGLVHRDIKPDNIMLEGPDSPAAADGFRNREDRAEPVAWASPPREWFWELRST